MHGTPTIITNGWMLGRPLTDAELDGMIKQILSGKPPVDQHQDAWRANFDVKPGDKLDIAPDQRVHIW